MYAKNTKPSAKREIQTERSAETDDRIALPGRGQTCERWGCARKGVRSYLLFLWEISPPNNEFYNLESIFEKFILWIWTCQKSSDAQQKSKHSFSVFRIIRCRMSSECFRRFPIGSVDSTVRPLPCILGGYLKKWKWASVPPSFDSKN